MTARDPQLAERARTMRVEATPPERAVWGVLRAVPFAGLHFRREVAFGRRYIADFASHRGKIVVEVDGRSHDASRDHDVARDVWFAGQGYRTVRITNAQALDRDQDLGALLFHLVGLSVPPPQPSPLSGFAGGGGGPFVAATPLLPAPSPPAERRVGRAGVGDLSTPEPTR